LSLLPEDDDDTVASFLPPEEQNAPDPDIFIEESTGGIYEEKKKTVIPKFNNLLPKHALAIPLAIAAWIIDLLYALLIYSIMAPWIHQNMGFYLTKPSTWLTGWTAFPGIFSAFLSTVMNDRKTFINVIFVGVPAVIITLVAIMSRNSESSCPVCKRSNPKNYIVCKKCSYMYMTRDMMDREILSVKLNNLDYTPEDVHKEFLERRLCDLTPKYIKHVLIKEHFL